MAISSPGIGSNLDVNGIVSKLMQVESQPLTQLNQQQASYQAKISALGSLSGALGAFQIAIGSLSSASQFSALSATAADSSVLSATAGTNAVAGSYSVNVTRLASSQTIATSGQASSTTSIGNGTISFQFGTIAAAGSALSAGVASGGIAAGSLSINGTTISTSAATTSAKALAAQINLASATTGVSATALATDTGAAAVGQLGALGAFTTITPNSGTYSLTVGGVKIVDQSSSPLDAAGLDAAIAAAQGALTSAGITVTGTAAGTGTNALRFTRADGSNIDVTETLTADAAGGFTSTVNGGTKTFTSSVSLTPAGTVTIGGTNPALAGFAAGSLSSNGVYGAGVGFTQDPGKGSGSVTIDASNNSLQGIRDAINSANIGVTASIVSDGSGTPYHLVLKSTATGVASSMKISVSGDAALSSLLAYDPAGTQNMTELTAAQNTALTVNGIAVTSATQSVSEAIQGTTLNVSKIGSTTLSIAKDTASVSNAVNAFVNAYNKLQSTIAGLTAYDSKTGKAGALLGDPTVRQVQSQIRSLLSSQIAGLSGTLTTYSQIGISFDKTGVMTLDNTKLQSAITNNYDGIAALFATVGQASDSLVRFNSSTSATKPGSYALNITALATKGSLTGNLNLNAAPTVIGANTTVNATVDGINATISLTAGSYTASQFASMLQSAINGASAISSAGSSVTASIDGSGNLSLVSNRYGSASNVSLSNATGTSVSAFLGLAPVPVTGTDVAGSINGVAALASGQSLTGAFGTPTEGLKLQITGGSLGARGTVNFSQGYASQLNQLLTGYLSSTGIIANATDGENAIIKDLKQRASDFNVRLTAIEARYRAQFTALDSLIGTMNATQSYLTQQLASISANSKGA